MRLPVLAFILPLLYAAAQIPAGSLVLLRSSQFHHYSHRQGRRRYVYRRTATPIVSGGQVVVPESTYVQGVVSHSRESGRVKGRAELGIRIEQMTLASGKVIQVNPNLSSVDAGGTSQKVDKEQEIKQGSDAGRDAARVATLPGGGAAIGGLADHRYRRRHRRWRGRWCRPRGCNADPRPGSGSPPGLNHRRRLRPCCASQLGRSDEFT